MSGEPSAKEFPDLPRDTDGPVFAEPWQAQVFAIAVKLHERGLFTWFEWSQRLGREIAHAQAAGDPDRGDTYYRHWLAALESLLTEKGVADAGELQALTEAWDRAARATPHGQPIVLEAGRRGTVHQTN